MMKKLKDLKKELDEVKAIVEAHRVEHGFAKMQDGGVNANFGGQQQGGPPGMGGMNGGGMPMGAGGMPPPQPPQAPAAS